MGKLIDVDEIRKYIGLSERCEDCDRDKNACRYDQVFTRMDICGWLDDQPEAVVRCRDCKYWSAESYEETGQYNCIYRPLVFIPVDGDHYCGHGEKR